VDVQIWMPIDCLEFGMKTNLCSESKILEVMRTLENGFKGGWVAKFLHSDGSYFELISAGL